MAAAAADRQAGGVCGRFEDKYVKSSEEDRLGLHLMLGRLEGAVV